MSVLTQRALCGKFLSPFSEYFLYLIPLPLHFALTSQILGKCYNLSQTLQDPVFKWDLLVQLPFLFHLGCSSKKGQRDPSFVVLTTADTGISFILLNFKNLTEAPQVGGWSPKLIQLIQKDQYTIQIIKNSIKTIQVL